MRSAWLTVVLAAGLFTPAPDLAGPLAPTRRASTGGRIRILVTGVYGERSNPVSGLVEANVLAKLAAQIQRLYPCTSVVTNQEAHRRGLLALDAEELAGQSEKEVDARFQREFTDAMDADLIFMVELGTTKPPDYDLGRYARTFLTNARDASIPFRDMVNGKGLSWAKDDLIDETMQNLRKQDLDICPWLGTIKYDRVVTKDTTSVVREAERTETTTDFENSSDHWTFERVRLRLGLVLVKASGSSSGNTRHEIVTDWTNVTCFPIVNGVVTDNYRVSGVSKKLVEHQDVSGSSSDPLVGVELKLIPTGVFKNGEELWMLSIMAGATGKATGKDYEEITGGCSTLHTDKPPSLLPPVFIAARLLGIDDMDQSRGVMANSRTLPATPFTVETLTWNLKRN